MLATRTFVYGEYERDVLIRHGAYRDDEVSVSGSPRLDLDQAFGPAATPGAEDRTADRDRVREEIGVAAGDRLLVVSTTNGPLVRRFYFADILGRLFDGPLPGVHVVFKQHPGEADEGPYRRVIEEQYVTERRNQQQKKKVVMIAWHATRLRKNIAVPSWCWRFPPKEL